jgi:hypothetical protein
MAKKDKANNKKNKGKMCLICKRRFKSSRGVAIHKALVHGKGSVDNTTTMTEKTVDKLEEAFAWGCTDAEACLHAGISKDTLYKHIKENPDFADRKKALKKKPILKARSEWIQKFGEDWKACRDYLERKLKDEFSRKEIHEQQNKTLKEFLDKLEKPE